MFTENDFYIPQFKYQYVAWLEKNYAKDKKGNKIDWNKFPLKRLKAIYIGIRNDYENAHASSSQSVGVRKSQIKNSLVHGDAPRQDAGSNPMVQSKETQICFDFGS
jgi:hypothetical protein